MTITATIKWDLALGSYGTKIQYKESSSSTWITPTVPANPTLSTEYPIQINEGVYYDVRLITIGQTGECSAITKQIFSPIGGSLCCPPTYVLSLDQSYCYKYNETTATTPTNSETLVKVSDIVYSTFGTLIYDPGFAVDGTGSNTLISLGNTYWVNSAPTNTTKGPLNRTAVWSTSQLSAQTIGYSVCITTPIEKTYYIGVGADNSVILKLDGTTFLNMDPTAMGAYLSANGFPGTGIDCTFKFWHIYPITISSGTHILELIGYNVSSVAGFGAQIYNATAAEIEAVTSDGTLAPYLLFSSQTEVGNPVQLGSDGIGYTCPSGYSLVLCDGSPKCRQFLTTSTIPC